MKNPILLLAVGAVAGWFLAGRDNPLSIDTLKVAHADEATAESAASSANTADDGNSKDSIDVRYAQAFLKLAQADLRKAQDANQRVPGTIPDSLLQPLAATVVVAQERLTRAQHPDDDKGNPYLQTAETMLKMARENWKTALTVNQRAAGAVPQTEVDRLQALTELAQVRVDQARGLDLKSPLACAAFDLEQLRLDVQQLNARVSQLRDRN